MSGVELNVSIRVLLINSLSMTAFILRSGREAVIEQQTDDLIDWQRSVKADLLC